MKCNFFSSEEIQCPEEAVSFYAWVDRLPGVHSDEKLYLRCIKHDSHNMATYPTLMQITYEEVLVLEVMES
jgi:hypothetical protein